MDTPQRRISKWQIMNERVLNMKRQIKDVKRQVANIKSN